MTSIRRRKQEKGSDHPAMAADEAGRLKESAGTSCPAPYHHGNLRATLIACGKKRLETEGVEVLSLRSIAADAGVSPAAPTHHFGNKEGLLAAIAADGFRDLIALRMARLQSDMTAEQKIRVFLNTYVEFAYTHSSLFQLMFAPQIKNRDLHQDLNSVGSESYHMMVRAMQDFIDEKRKAGKSISISGDEATRFAWCSMHGVATLFIEMRFNPDGAMRFSRTKLVTRTIDLVLTGIQNDTAA
jgi:AcrR family transcriptional regulator